MLRSQLTVTDGTTNPVGASLPPLPDVEAASVMNNRINFTRGVNNKPVASDKLVKCLKTLEDVSGEVFIGYPIIPTPDGGRSMDAILVSPEKGIVIFDLIESNNTEGYAERQDDLANMLEAKLKLHSDIVEKRQLAIHLDVISYAPGVGSPPSTVEGEPPLATTEEGLCTALEQVDWDGKNDEVYERTLSAIEGISTIRKGRAKRKITRDDSRGAKLKRLEDSIATLDHDQSRAFIETVEGVQRIRGLAGSGKTVVLALKAAYLHTQHPDWRIAVTFYTRSLKGQFRRLINRFCIEQSGEEPDWEKIRVIHAWGAPGGEDKDGIYYEFCRSCGAEYHDFRSAAAQFGRDKAFEGACQAALGKKSKIEPHYDAILVDEAQDFFPSFLKLCYEMVKEPKRLVYAYDELQNLSGVSLPSPEEIFGSDVSSYPPDERSKRDIILHKCYRNSRPVLVTAHGLGFGIYRKAPQGAETGLVQMFDNPLLWEDIGYQCRNGQLAKGQHVELVRTSNTSPKFLEDHSSLDDLVEFKLFADASQQNEWLIQQIHQNVESDELSPNDIIVIHPDPITARRATGPILGQLFEEGIQAHLAGVDTSADVFYKSDTPSVTFTGIYRAKGNEAGMVYVINAQSCSGWGLGLASARNRLFTAITRSKAWVRVVGHGPGMQELIDEFELLKNNNFTLDFTYPNDELLGKLRLVHRDISAGEKQKIERRNRQIDEIVRDLDEGSLHLEDLDPQVREKLKKLLGEQQ